MIKMMLLAFSLSLLFIGFVHSEMEEDSYDFEGRADLDWDYKDTDAWKNQYPDCGGKNQSPINLTYIKLNTTRRLRFIHYNAPRRVMITNKGYTVELQLFDRMAAPCIEGGGLDGRYCFTQLHFHWGLNNSAGAEHALNGGRGVAELHLVHTKEDGTGNGTPDIAVLGIMYIRTSSDNVGLRSLTAALRNVTYKGDSTILRRSIRLSDLVPPSLFGIFRYKGSLTTPPCTENVSWTVFHYPMGISNRQLKEFRKLMRTEKGNANPQTIAPNYRPLQSLNNRELLLLFPVSS